MTKELSKQICELCNIEPCYCFQVYEGIIFTEQGEDLETAIRKHRLDVDKATSDIMEEAEKIWVDFSKPENFVRLLEIIPEQISLVEIVLQDFCYVDRTKFLENLICILKSSRHISDETKKRIKQAIKNTEWKY